MAMIESKHRATSDPEARRNVMERLAADERIAVILLGEGDDLNDECRMTKLEGMTNHEMTGCHDASCSSFDIRASSLPTLLTSARVHRGEMSSGGIIQ